MKLKVVILVTLMGLLSFTALAQARNEKDLGTFSFCLENDYFARTDRDYTSGVRLTYVSPNLSDKHKKSQLLQWISSLSKKSPFGNKPGFHRA